MIASRKEPILKPLSIYWMRLRICYVELCRSTRTRRTTVDSPWSVLFFSLKTENAILELWLASCDWLSHHGVWAIIPCSPNYNCTRLLKIKNELKIVCFYKKSREEFSKFLGVFNKTVIPLTLVGYEIMIANSGLRASLALCHLISVQRALVE